ncbi:hypothetical protein ACFYZ8_33195 [Streptomyces sp. NPDC001668]|uniref:hypothetical protein n=1 Tax=Streptomyces sp. NPDC001668 TaxID=3364598 RepID=UPI00367F31D1
MSSSPSTAHVDGGGAQYRADFSDAETYSPLEPVYDDLASAQERCETDLRSAWPDGDALEITWQPDESFSWWRMMVRTPRMREPVSAGYSVTIVDCEFDGVRQDSPAAGTTR